MLYGKSSSNDPRIIMIRKLIEEYKAWGLETNTNKTEYMCTGGQ